MGISRRNTLVGLGGLIAGGGALAATGAFDTVEADRTVNVETAGDASALLAIEAAPDAADEIVTDDDDVFVLDIGAATTSAGGGGLNRNARTVFDELVQLTNQGTQEVDTITLELSGDGADVLEIQDSNVSDDTPLGTGDSTTFGMEVDLTLSDDTTGIDGGDIDDDSFNPTLTITAENTN